MFADRRLPTPSEIITRQLLLIGRSDVQCQLIVIFLCIIASWFLSKRFWRWLQKEVPHLVTFDWGDHRLAPRDYLAVLIQTLDFPAIAIILLSLSRAIFRSQDWTRGLLAFAVGLMWCYVGYRFFTITLYSAFPLKVIRKYHARLLAPLFILFILGEILGLYDNLHQLARISIFKIFNSSVTPEAIFWLTIGLYFWITIVFLIEDISLIFFRSKTQLELGRTQATLLLLRYFLVTLGTMFILGYVGVNGTAIAAITGGLSVGIGFGLQQVVSNFVSGILLLFEGVLKPGDIISIGGETCTVKRLGIRATTVLNTTDNSEKIIPNQTFFTSDVTTYTGSDRLVYCAIEIGVGYDSSSETVIDLLLQIAKQHPRVLENPAPVVFFLNFGDSSLNFQLKFWLDDINTRKRVISDLTCSILEVFNNHNIEIPFPQRDIRIRDG